MSRRALVALLVGVAVAIAAGSAAAAGPKKRLRPADNALARTLAVERADLAGAGWKSSPSSSSGGSGLGCKGFDPDQSDLTETGRAEGPELSNDALGAYVSSTIGVFSTATQARTWWTRVVRPQLARCLGDVFRSGAQGPQTKVRITSTARVAFPRVTQDSAEFRVAAALTISGRPVKAFLDIVVLHHGRVDAAVIAAGIARPYADFRKVALAVARRMARA